jgi:hypothetical protein
LTPEKKASIESKDTLSTDLRKEKTSPTAEVEIASKKNTLDTTLVSGEKMQSQAFLQPDSIIERIKRSPRVKLRTGADLLKETAQDLLKIPTRKSMPNSTLVEPPARSDSSKSLEPDTTGILMVTFRITV